MIYLFIYFYPIFPESFIKPSHRYFDNVLYISFLGYTFLKPILLWIEVKVSTNAEFIFFLQIYDKFKKIIYKSGSFKLLIKL